MASPKGYTNITNLQNYLLITIDASFTSQVGTTWLLTVEQIIEQFTGRNFIADAAASQKTFEVKLQRAVDIGGTFPSVRSLIIEEAVSVTGLTIDGDEVDSGDWLLYPMNDTPKIEIRLRNTSTATLTIKEQNIKVTAKWGYSVSVPSDIEWAATVLLAGIVQHSWSSEGEVQSVTLGRYTMTYKTKKEMNDFETVKEILKTYQSVL